VKTVSVKSNSRLHFGLLDLSGISLRVDGGVGISIGEPSVEVTVSKNHGLCINGTEDTVIICKNAINKLSGIIKDYNFKVEIKTHSLSHIGLGLGTQCTLSVAKAIAVYFDRNIDSLELATLVQRGGTSAIGVYSFCVGGFIVDGGRSWKDEKTFFGPSNLFAFKNLPPLIARHEFPQWGICVIVPKQKKRINGVEECKLFNEFAPVPACEVDEACKWILMGMIPSVVTRNLTSFCESLVKYQSLGFKRKEIEYADMTVHKSMELLKNYGFQGVGMSSWGPAVFGFAENIFEAEKRAEGIKKEELVDKVWVVTGNNSGAIVSIATE
jgi:beta-RFAP synthase